MPSWCVSWHRVGMNVPILPAVDVIGDNSPVTIGLAIGLLFVGGAWGQATMQIASLREWRKSKDAEDEALRGRVTAMEVREGRTVERVDALFVRLDRIEAKLDKLLERRDVA